MARSYHEGEWHTPPEGAYYAPARTIEKAFEAVNDSRKYNRRHFLLRSRGWRRQETASELPGCGSMLMPVRPELFNALGRIFEGQPGRAVWCKIEAIRQEEYTLLDVAARQNRLPEPAANEIKVGVFVATGEPELKSADSIDAIGLTARDEHNQTLGNLLLGREVMSDLTTKQQKDLFNIVNAIRSYVLIKLTS